MQAKFDEFEARHKAAKDRKAKAEKYAEQRGGQAYTSGDVKDGSEQPQVSPVTPTIPTGPRAMRGNATPTQPSTPSSPTDARQSHKTIKGEFRCANCKSNAPKKC